ncbi:MAG: hypothetical protein ACRDJE_17125 [Dehalococcoidia bacterium]
MESKRIEAVKRWGFLIALVAAPLLILGAEMLSPIDHERDSAQEMLVTLADKGGRYQAAVLLILAGMGLMIPATLALARLCGQRGRWYALIGSVLLVAGLVAFTANIGAMGLALTALATLPAEQREATAAGIEAILEGKGAIPWTFPVLLAGLVIGPLLLAIGLWRGHLLTRWAALGVPAGWWLFFFGPSHLARALGAVLLLAALTLAAWRLSHDADAIRGAAVAEPRARPAVAGG